MKIGLIQLTSVLEPEMNLQKIRGFLKEAKDKKVECVFLPETFYSLTDNISVTPYLVEVGNTHYQAIQNLAKEFSLPIIGGSAATRLGDQVVNRTYSFDAQGRDLGHYDKTHLFACDVVKDGKRKKVDESEHFSAGTSLKVITFGELRIGLSICFDLRFSPLYWNYAAQGCNLITIASAFTRPTGEAHWHTLVRARAIETQSFIVAAGQWGEHNARVQTYGHSLIVDPWGDILVDAGEGEKLVMAEIDLSLKKDVGCRIHIPH